MRDLNLLIVLAASLTLGACASSPQQGYDARLSSYDYPYPTHTFRLDSQRQQLEMVYMDVRPDEPNGRTVLLLHGKNFSGAYWATTIDALTQQGYRVIAPDQIGFGKSSKPTFYHYTFHTLADNTARLLDHLNVEQVDVVGHSMGGMVATRFALMFEERANSLTLVNPIGLEDWKRDVPYVPVETRYANELDKTPQAVRSYMKASYFDGQWKPAYDPLVEIQVGWIRGPDYPRIAWTSALTYDMIFTQPVLYEFGDLSMPTLLIIGGRDRTALGKGSVPSAVAQTLGRYDQLGERTRDAIPHATLVKFEGIGHIPQFEAFDRYRDALTKFLAQQ